MIAVKRVLGRPRSAVALQMSKCTAIVLFVLAAARAACALPAPAADTATITRLLQTSAAYWNSGKLDDFMKSYENSPATIYIGSKTIVTGYDAIRTHYATAYRGSHVGTLSFSGLLVRRLSPGYTFVVAHWHLRLHDGTHPSGIFSLVMHRSEAGWRIVADHSP